MWGEFVGAVLGQKMPKVQVDRLLKDLFILSFRQPIKPGNHSDPGRTALLGQTRQYQRLERVYVSAIIPLEDLASWRTDQLMSFDTSFQLQGRCSHDQTDFD